MNEAFVNGAFRSNITSPPAGEGVMSLFSLAGKTAVISGAGSGIGLAVAQAFAEAGANVAIWYNANKNAIEAAENISKTYNVKCKAYKVDVTSFEAVDEAITTAIQDLNGRLDVFVANAGIISRGEPFIDDDIKYYHDLVKVNTDGVVYCAHSAGRHFRRQKQEGTTIDGAKLDNFTSGSFIATCSISGHIVNVPRPQAAYNSSKATLIHLCKSLALEWLGFARANSVSPGFIRTDIAKDVSQEVIDSICGRIPMGRFAETREVQGIYLYLASDASSYATGADFLLDGGYTLP